ncbi:hypothetical protein CYY_005880 [Polysphondylium violaceum]|uniref:TLDc domain-containing protein n=1 Tax=Polysphondylium violaceum TaxID=133409 RepID=A0A8J4Q1Z1_9MYCE|nr:hypothetical protein CYY_005880 [Polysphondylium violaceum]
MNTTKVKYTVDCLERQYKADLDALIREIENDRDPKVLIHIATSFGAQFSSGLSSIRAEIYSLDSVIVREKIAGASRDTASSNSSNSGNDIIKLNIGGVLFETTRTTLNQSPFFNKVFSGEIKVQKSEGNSYFIDRDGTHFNYVLAYLRDGSNEIPESIKNQVKKEMVYYQIGFLDSQIGNLDTFKIINDWIDSTKQFKFELLYRASENEFEASTFHEKCDGQGATITLIKTTDGNIFGGYNSQSWTSNPNSNGDNKCFIFTLVNKHGIKPTKYLANPEKERFIYSNRQSGPGFGTDDISLLKQDTSYQQFPSSAYIDTTSQGEKTLTPSDSFILQEYEVFKVLEN